MSPKPEETTNEIALCIDTYSDDESTLASERDGDRDSHGYRLDLDSDDASSSSSSMSDFSFVLDIGLVERSRQQARSRTCVPLKEDASDALETDSLKLIRRRVPTQEKDQVRAVTPNSPHALSFKKISVHSSFVEVCEVPLGVSLKDILPSTLCYSSRSKPNFHQLVRDTNRSESVLEDIEKALEILSVNAN